MSETSEKYPLKAPDSPRLHLQMSGFVRPIVQNPKIFSLYMVFLLLLFSCILSCYIIMRPHARVTTLRLGTLSLSQGEVPPIFLPPTQGAASLIGLEFLACTLNNLTHPNKEEDLPRLVQPSHAKEGWCILIQVFFPLLL